MAFASGFWPPADGPLRAFAAHAVAASRQAKKTAAHDEVRRRQRHPGKPGDVAEN
jgi:hypothetical protein